jgi:PAS domain S-box-containing protein
LNPTRIAKGANGEKRNREHEQEDKMDWQYTPYVFPLLIAATIAAMLALFAWRHHSAPGARSFAALMFAAAWWATAYALQLSRGDLQAKIVFCNVSFLGVVAVPTAWLAFAIEYTGRGQWLTRRKLLLLAIFPLLTALTIWTDGWHHWFRYQATVSAGGPYRLLDVTNGPAFWLHAAYSYAMLMAGAFLLLQASARSPHVYRGQTLAILIGILAPWAANVITVARLIPSLHLDLTPFAFILSGLSIGWALLRFGLLDVTPVARDTIIESMSDGVIVLDIQDRIVDINPVAEGILTCVASEAIGQPALQILSRWPDLVERYHSLAETHTEIAVGEGVVRRYFDLRISPLRDRQRHLTGRLIVLRDVTVRKEMEEALQRAKEVAEAANRAKDEFISVVTHELRSPLSSVLGSVGLLEDGEAGPISEEQRDFLHIIGANTKRMAALASDLADISRIESGQLQLEMGAVSLPEVIGEVVRSTRLQIKQKGQKLILQVSQDLPQVWADRIRLVQVITNLVSNAHKFTPEGGTIAIRAERTANRWDPQGAPQVVHIAVEDNGIGIQVEELDKLFQKFSRVGDRNARRVPGTGLGLSIAKNLVEMQGGRIWCESKFGQGSIFHFTVPMVEESHEALGE